MPSSARPSEAPIEMLVQLVDVPTFFGVVRSAPSPVPSFPSALLPQQ